MGDTGTNDDSLGAHDEFGRRGSDEMTGLREASGSMNTAGAAGSTADGVSRRRTDLTINTSTLSEVARIFVESSRSSGMTAHEMQKLLEGIRTAAFEWPPR